MINSNLTEHPQPLAVKTAASNNNDTMKDLIQRVSHEVESAEERINSIRAGATEAFLAREQRLAKYVTVVDHIHAILMPRLEAFRNIEVFNDLQQTESPESTGNLQQKPVLNRTTTLTASRCTKRPHTLEFSFRIDHDEPIKNAVIDYRLRILPIFIKFKDKSQLLVPFDKLDDQSISAWIDKRLVDFTRTYFEVYFHDEYQKQSLQTDPVMNIRFPKSAAVAEIEFQNRIYHFCTRESFQRFEKHPFDYVQSVS